MSRRASHWQLELLALALLVLGGCSAPTEDLASGPEWLVIGIDGADWTTIHQLWDQGELPALKGLADRGVATVLRTSYGASPVIWTSVATGVTPEVHGITGFAVPTPDGDVPVSSRVRKVPALWNMLTTAGRRTSVVSWWASWPAEAIDGVIISDRAGLDVADAVSPPALSEQFERWRLEALAEENLFDPRVSTFERDQVTSFAARQLLEVPFDLALVYFRGVDIASHRFWKYHQPERFPEVTAAQSAEFGDIVAATYRATDAAIGDLISRVGPRTNVMVLSDHGFYAMKREEVRIMLDFDRVLERLAFQRRTGDKIDWSGTRLFTFATAGFRLIKRVRFAPDVAPEARPALRSALTAELAKITYTGGEPVFHVRDPNDREARTGADFVVDVQRRGATRDLRYGAEAWPRMISEISYLSGTHSEHTHGVLFAAGPDVDPAAPLDGIHIHDITPTLLYGLGLPVAEDFAGRAWVELFTPGYQARRPLRTVASWGTLGAGDALASPADEEILDDLRALGYID
jgi:predicted AlkP superfamily phosphohydrolase/phosphomutase